MGSVCVETSTVPRDVPSYMTFLSRDELYLREKPYTTDYPVDDIEGAKITNHIFNTRPITFHDARGVEEPFSLDRNGFCYVKAKTSLRPEQATSERTEVMELYMKEIVDVLLEKLPQYQDIRPMDFQVRRRDPAFPNDKERRAEFSQPSIMAHTDFSPRGAFLRMADIFPDDPSCYEDRKFELIKLTFLSRVWRVLKGPNNDWPLGLCDFNLVSAADDTTTNDALHYKRVGENSLLHHSDTQRWYYLSDMEDDDLIVFRNTDSEGKMPRGFHASFHNPYAAGELRHSVEVRLVAFRDKSG